MNFEKIAKGINKRFSPDFDWPEGFVQARQTTDGGFSLQIGYSDIEFDKEGNLIGGGTNLLQKELIDIKIKKSK